MRTLLLLILFSAIAALCIKKFGFEESMPYVTLVGMCVGLVLVGQWLVAGVKMTQDDPTRPMKIETFNDNYQASILVARFEQNEIKATAVGGFVSGFQAESPGYVDVVVAQSDFDRATSLYDDWKTESEET